MYFIKYIEIVPEINPLTKELDYHILAILKNEYVFKINGNQSIMCYGFNDLEKILSDGISLCTI